jgi:hypothetical protein
MQLQILGLHLERERAVLVRVGAERFVRLRQELGEARLVVAVHPDLLDRFQQIERVIARQLHAFALFRILHRICR